MNLVKMVKLSKINKTNGSIGINLLILTKTLFFHISYTHIYVIPVSPISGYSYSVSVLRGLLHRECCLVRADARDWF